MAVGLSKPCLRESTRSRIWSLGVRFCGGRARCVGRFATIVIRQAESSYAHWQKRHFEAGMGRKKRNAILRKSGCDAAGEPGEIYRAVYRALIEAMRGSAACGVLAAPSALSCYAE